MSRERALTWALCALGAAAPLAIAGAHPFTQVALSAAALGITAAYVFAIRGARGLRLVPLVTVAALAVALSAAQLLPLPGFLVRLLSPQALALRSEALGRAPSLLPLSLDAPATWLAVVRAWAGLGLLITVAGFARARKRAHPILLALAVLGGGMALITFAQRALGLEAILGIYQLRSWPGSGFFGTFVNGNHAASLFALTGLVSVGLAFELEGARRFLVCWCALLCAAALLYTQSRAGAAGFGLGLLALLAAVLVRRFGRATGLITALVATLVAASVTLWTADGLRARLTPARPEALWDNQKTRGWLDGLKLAAAYPWTGVGRGAFEAPVARYRSEDEGVRLVYPENLLVQRAAEWGLPATLVLLGLALAGAVQVLRPLGRLEAGTLGAAAGVLAVLTHELADFGLELPGVAFPTAIALGVVIARSEERGQHDRSKRPRLSRRVSAAALAGWAVALGGGLWAAGHSLESDFDRARTALKAKAPETGPLLSDAIARHPADDHLELLAVEQALAGGDPRAALQHLNRALRLHPSNWQAHRLAARTLASVDRKAQAALEYRLALERGMPALYQEIFAVVGLEHAIDAVPQRPAELSTLARTLLDLKRPAEASAACARAVERAERPEATLLECLKVAQAAGAAEGIAAAAAALLATGPSAASCALAARALHDAGQTAAADQAVQQAIKAHPEEAELVLLGARLGLERGDVAGGRAFLKRTSEGQLTLAHRQEAEELLAALADKAGDVDGAVLARARARMIARRRKETSAMENPRP